MQSDTRNTPGWVDLERLRQALLASPSADELPAQHSMLRGGSETLTSAAVLIPIILHPDAPTILLTRRTAHLKDHADQISFPGGRVETGDASPAHTALREAAEEVGLQSVCVEIVGYLPEYLTITGFRVTPVVAMVQPPVDLRLDPNEVAEVFEVPLAFLLDPAQHQRHSHHDRARGRLRQYDAIPYGDHFIWGATAGMILSLYRAISRRP
jgi:8-oxo-dGTP pyrophosphatase MutT (NUDIX family)